MSRAPRNVARGGAAFLGSSLLVLAFLVLLALFLQRHDLRHDFTRGKRLSLAPQSVQVVKELDRPVRLLAFYPDDPNFRLPLFELVERYRRVNPRLELEFVDPDRRPELTESYGVTVAQTVVLVDGDLQIRTHAPRESDLTGALIRILERKPPLVFFVSGHGEASIESDAPGGIRDAAQLLRRQNFQLRVLNTAAAGRIPADADIVVVPSAERNFTDREMAMLADYLLRGGRLMTMVEPLGSTSVDSLATLFGVSPDPGFVVDASEERRNLTGNGNFRFAVALGGNPEHPITQDFTLTTIFPLARSLRSVQPPPPGVEAVQLLGTQLQAWSEMELSAMADGRPEFDDGIDRGGPLPLGYAVTVNLRRFEIDPDRRNSLSSTVMDMMGDRIDLRDPSLADSVQVGDQSLEGDLPDEARLVVLGDVDFINNANLKVQGNADFFLGCMLWLADKQNRIALAPRPDLSDPIVLSQRQRKTLRWTFLGAVPLLFFAMAGWVTWQRRRWV